MPTAISMEAWGAVEATTDDKGRVRLSSNYAAHFGGALADRNAGEPLKLLLASLNKQDILLWEKADFFNFRDWLISEADEKSIIEVRRLLKAVQLTGGETELDEKGRVLIPRSIRSELGIQSEGTGPLPNIKFRLINDGVIRLERLSTSELPTIADSCDLEVDQFATIQYLKYLGAIRRKERTQ